MTSASPRSILVFSGRYHIISNASLVNNCIMFHYVFFCQFSLKTFNQWYPTKLKIGVYEIQDLYIGSYMSAHVLLNLLNELGKEIKCEACRAFYLFFATSLINLIIQEHEC